jgi:hypothetical protein
MTDWASLNAALGGIPDLRDAACAGRWNLFDPEQDRVGNQPVEDPTDRHERAIEICLYECRAYEQCRDHQLSLPRAKRAVGIVAGELYHASFESKKKKAS